jgi:hypothetical protein
MTKIAFAVATGAAFAAGAASATFAAVRSIRERPRISKFRFPARPFYWTDFFPFALLRRAYPAGLYR